MNLTSAVQYGAKIGWHQGTLSLVDDVLSLKDENGNIVFEYELSEISKVVNRHTIWLGIYTPDKRGGWAISFGNMYSEAAGIAGGAAGVLAADSEDRKAQLRMQEWLDFFQSKGLLVQGFNLYEYRQIIWVAGLIIMFVMLLVGAIIGLSNNP